MKKLVILGAGGYGGTVKDVAEQLDYERIAVLDDNFPTNPLSSFDKYVADDTEFIVAFGNNKFRIQWCERIIQSGGNLATLVHPMAYVSPKARIEPGTVVLPKAVINQGTRVGKGCIINLGAIIDHGCVVEEGVHICIGAIVKAENRVNALTKIEAGEVIKARTWSIDNDI